MPRNPLYPAPVKQAQRTSYLIHQANNGGLLPNWDELTEEQRNEWEATILVAIATYAREAAKDLEGMSAAFMASLDGFVKATEAMRERIKDLQADLLAVTRGETDG